MGRHEPDAIPEMLAARERQAAGPTAPPHGLYLQWIRMKPTPAEAADAPPLQTEPAGGVTPQA
jgi:tRNA pseudouridine38-40 synthase